MKKTIQILILTVLFSSSIFAQSTERFIRIIGNSKKEIKARNAKVYFTISEVKASKYAKNKEEITYENAYNEAISKLSKVGIKESDIKLALKKRSYNNTNSKNFYIETELGNLDKLSNIVSNGFRITSTMYLFSEIDNNLETELSLKAIKDAKRKAKAICDDIDKKVGKILNIEVKEGDFSTNKKENKENSYIKTYKVTITFKLVD